MHYALCALSFALCSPDLCEASYSLMIGFTAPSMRLLNSS
jgi:hypothetical protein